MHAKTPPVVFKQLPNGIILITPAMPYDVPKFQKDGWKVGDLESMEKVEGGYNLFIRSDD